MRRRKYIMQTPNLIKRWICCRKWETKETVLSRYLLWPIITKWTFPDFYRLQRSWGKVIFSQASVILLTGGCAIPAWIAGGIPACLAAGLWGVCSWGVSVPGSVCSGGVCSWGSAPGGSAPEGWPSVMAFCCGLLLCPSGLVAFWLKVAFWYGVLGARRP